MNLSLPQISQNAASSQISSGIKAEYQSIEEHIKFTNETEFFQDMENKLQRLKAFIDSLGPLKDTQIVKELLQEFQRDADEFRQIGSDSIVIEAVKRIQKMKKAKKLKKNWSSSDMKVLIWVICKYAQQQSINLSQIQSHDEFWKFISSVIPGTTAESCLFKWLSERRYKITLHSWKTEEQQLLLELQKKYVNARNKWKVISEELYLQNTDKDKIFRHPKQCRQHYASFLDPNIVKGPWSRNEDNILLTQIGMNNGEKKWCRLTKILEGRTENAIKNRYQLLFSKLKKRKENKSKNEYEIVMEYLKQSDPEFQIKKQRVQAVKNCQQEKSSVIKAENNTIETIQSAQKIPNPPSIQKVFSQPGPRIVIPIVLKHGSNFRPFSQNQELFKQRKNSFMSLCEGGIISEQRNLQQ